MSRAHGPRTPLARAVASGLIGLALGACMADDAPEDWALVETGELILGVEVTGALEAVVSDRLSPPAVPDMWDYKISKLAPEGQDVKAGDKVLAFDASTLVQTLAEKTNEADAAAKELEKQRLTAAMNRKQEGLDLAEAEARLRKSTLQADRPADLTGALELRQAELDRSIAEAEVAYRKRKTEAAARRDAAIAAALRDKRDRARARVAEIQQSMAKLNIGAPRAGTVIYPTNWRGDKKKVGDSAWRAETVLEIASLDEMRAAGEVDEVDASRVAVAQAVTLRLDALADVLLTGKVASIVDTVQRQSHQNPLKVVKLRIELDPRQELSLRPGMRFRGTVIEDRIADVVKVPTEAVFVTRTGPVAYRKTDDGYETVAIELGRRSKTHVEVVSGLRPGDRVSRRDLGSEAEGSL